jgi:CubicO group peptidase (beta-lactamase class C family)
MKPDAAKKIDAGCKEWAADDDQAFAVCIARKGIIVLHAAYGTRDGKPITVTTKSWMASITKPMSATLMMMLADQGLVSLDDPVEKYLPALRELRKDNPLTIRHLYTHTSGLDKWPAQWYQDELPDIEERVALAYPVLTVGKAWSSNGQGYTLGGKVIEAVTGEAIPQCLHRHLLAPLSCEHTDVIGTHADAQSVPLDMARFGQMLLNGGAYGKQRYFRQETFEKMLPEKLTRALGPQAEKTFGIGLDGTREKFGHGRPRRRPSTSIVPTNLSSS